MNRLKNKIPFYLLLVWLITSCKSKTDNFDATGVFEAEEIIVSAESTGKLQYFVADEGDSLMAKQLVAQIDCDNIDLQKAQVKATIAALNMKKSDAKPQVQILLKQIDSQKALLNIQKTQLKVIEKERERFQKLVVAAAVPQKQLDDLDGQIEILLSQMANTQSQIALINQQIASQKAQISIQNRGVLSEAQPLKVRIEQFNEQMRRCKVVNPIAGTILVKYSQNQEVVVAGKPIYKIANLNNLLLRAYIAGTQIGQIKVGQKVRLFIDDGQDSYRELPGTVSWISSKSEFTPKTIQTKDERANLVYATKIRVKNDGFLKIGMYGEVKFK